MASSDVLRVVVGVSTALVVLACIAAAVVLSLNGKPTPSFLEGIAWTATGGLTASLAPLATTRATPRARKQHVKKHEPPTRGQA